MSVHYYPLGALRADYIRSIAGLALSAGPLFLAATHPVAVTALAALSALFLSFGVRTGMRQMIRIEVSDEAISQATTSVPGLGARDLPWSRLTNLRLRYYSTRRGKGAGWMQLVLKTPAGTLKLESSLEDFTAIAKRAARAARDQGLTPDPATVENLAALGIRYEAGRPIASGPVTP